tara:strand:+ start:184 stop:321 length:138 start_codon:yes stop_codon:yes gene_type:complete
MLFLKMSKFETSTHNMGGFFNFFEKSYDFSHKHILRITTILINGG